MNLLLSLLRVSPVVCGLAASIANAGIITGGIPLTSGASAVTDLPAVASASDVVTLALNRAPVASAAAALASPARAPDPILSLASAEPSINFSTGTPAKLIGTEGPAADLLLGLGTTGHDVSLSIWETETPADLVSSRNGSRGAAGAGSGGGGGSGSSRGSAAARALAANLPTPAGVTVSPPPGTRDNNDPFPDPVLNPPAVTDPAAGIPLPPIAGGPLGVDPPLVGGLPGSDPFGSGPDALPNPPLTGPISVPDVLPNPGGPAALPALDDPRFADDGALHAPAPASLLTMGAGLFGLLAVTGQRRRRSSSRRRA